MAFDMDDLKNKGENFANEHKDDAERLAREKLGGTNQRDTNGDMSGGGTNSQNQGQGMDSDRSDADMQQGRQDDAGMRDDTDERDYDDVA